MHAAGIRGARLNIVDLREGKGQLPMERITSLAERIKPFGWHIEFLMHVDDEHRHDGVPCAERRKDRIDGDLLLARARRERIGPGEIDELDLLSAGKRERRHATLDRDARIVAGASP